MCAVYAHPNMQIHTYVDIFAPIYIIATEYVYPGTN